jgi:hypothetical protein
MKSEEELKKAILDVLSKIRTDFPELVKFVNEIPAANSSTSGENVNRIELESYYNSLIGIYKEYAKKHGGIEVAKKSQNFLKDTITKTKIV